ncbi:MAG: DUF3783 domain-containing protein [Oscillospiraceae bacterium]|nr:DUF3783 domain-containing protein [Oscillospiraceae bacterium]
MAMPVILAYHLSPERLGRIRALCAVEKLRLRPVAPSEYGRSVGALAGLLPLSDAAAPVGKISEEMLVLCGLDEAALNRFLQAFRRLGVPPVALKAVLTPTNAAWNALTLYQELRREREAMGRL